MAGENLAYGQQNSIFAHEGLMNSLGHRKNILNTNFSTLGVGVDFNENDNHIGQKLYGLSVLTRLIKGIFLLIRKLIL